MVYPAANEKITPEQQALLNGINPHQYLAEQELSESKVTTNSENDKEKKGKNNSNNGLDRLKAKFKNKIIANGFNATRILPNGQRAKGRYVLVEAGGVTPSHNPNSSFTQSDDFPRRPDGKTINDRDYQTDKAAQEQVRQRANNYDGRAVQDMPIVDSNGVVLSGNDRTMSGELAANQNTDKEYLDFLRDNAQMYGFTEADVTAASHPRLVFVLDEQMSYTTETFALFNKDERKSQGLTQKAIKIGKTIKETTINLLARLIDGHDSIAEVWAKKTKRRQHNKNLAK